MATLRVACVGTGYFSQFHYDAWRRIEAVELVGAASLSKDEAALTGLVPFDDVQEMLDTVSPDLVDVITPPESHLEIIEKCVQEGVKAIICQKPFCTSLEQAERAVSLCAKAGIKLVVHENFRFQPWYRAMKQAIDRGVIGEVQQLTFRLRTGDGQGSRAYLDRQPYFQKMKKFLIRETGVHWLDTFRFLLGSPTAVYADLRQLNPAISGEDAGYFIMDFDGGRRALFDGNRHLDHQAENCRTTLGEALLEGDKGTITLSGSGELKIRKFGAQESRILLPAKNWDGFAGDCVHALQFHVIESLLGKEIELENEAEDYLTVIKLEEAVYDSALEGKKVWI